MKKSSKFLVAGTFFTATLVFAGSVFASLGLDFGLSQMIGSTVAGAVGAARLVS